MSRQNFQEDWVPFRDAILSRYPELTDGDLADADGSTAELARRIAERQEIDPAEAQERLHEFLEGPMPADAYADPTHDNAAAQDSGQYVPAGEDPLADDNRFGDDHNDENPVGRNR
ncbi:hypothetical protein JSE7799_02435 [Jannaschia seosinensis]|uniref:Uncharacterized protein n=1 Tax=Jannaschia seosinensis TaxID=313367 RepID=A0A0M7BA94_9RHOB|nr:hypothetical protein [Jannaschia seosinensis]CUH39707.1 hypothetical protein JSE7799_02435 [Jannaschia seosinensis]